MRPLRFLSILLFAVCFLLPAAYAAPPGDTVRTTDTVMTPTPSPIVSQATPFNYGTLFAIFAILVIGMPFVVELFKKSVGTMPSIAIQLVSWIIGILLTALAYWLGIRVIHEMTWYYSVLYGIGAGLACNGLYDTGIIKWLMSMFVKRE